MRFGLFSYLRLGLLWAFAGNLGAATELEISANQLYTSEGSSPRLALVRRGDLSETLSVSYATAPGTAEAGSDFVPAMGTLVFLPGEEIKELAITLIDDAMPEDTEEFSLTFTTTSEVTWIRGNQISIIVEDNDPGISLNWRNGDGQAMIRENAEAAFFEISRPAPFDSRGGSIEFVTTPLSAVAGKDYLPVRRTLVFVPGETIKRIAVPLLDNDRYDGPRTFLAYLTNATPGLSLGHPRRVTVTIQDDEAGFHFNVLDSWTVRDQWEIRETPYEAEVEIAREGAVNSRASVLVSTRAGTAEAGVDFVPVEKRVVFEPGERAQRIKIQALTDDVTENTETFDLGLSDPSGPTPLSSAAVLHVLIYDTTPSPQPWPFGAGWFINRYWKNLPAENGPPATIQIGRNSAYRQPLSISYAVSPLTALPGIDYEPASGTLNFAPNEAQKEIAITIINNQTWQPQPRKFKVTFQMSLPGFELPDLEMAITDDELGYVFGEPAPAIQASTQVTRAVVPANAGTVDLDVFRVGQFNVSSSVDYVIAEETAYCCPTDSARAGVDFVPATGTLHFAPGETNQVIKVRLLDHPTARPDRAFTVYLTNASPGVPIAPINNALFPTTGKVLVIRDNEDNPARVDPGFSPQARYVGQTFGLAKSLRLAFQPDGRILMVTGANVFTGGSGEAVVRLRADGSIDPDYHPARISPRARQIQLQADGKLLVIAGTTSGTGDFTLNGQPRRFVARLLANGNVDETFVCEFSAGDSDLSAILPQADGKLLAASVAGGVGAFRLNETGAVDTGFPILPGFCLGLYSQSRDKVILHGSLSGLSGMLRLFSDGKIDPAFPTLFNRPFGIQSDGKILAFENNGDSITRYDRDGKPDVTFASVKGPIYLAKDDTIWTFRDLRTVDGNYYSYGLTRCDRDGREIDGSRFSLRANSSVNSVTEDADGDLLIGGQFSLLNGQPRPGLARILVNPGLPRFEITADSARVPENQKNPKVKLFRVGESSEAVSVAWAIDGGSAIPDVHYRLPAGQFTFGPLETEKTLPVELIDDDQINPDRTVRLKLWDPLNPVKTYPPVEFTILNDELGFWPANAQLFANGKIELNATGLIEFEGIYNLERSVDLRDWRRVPLLVGQPQTGNVIETTLLEPGVAFYRLSREFRPR